MKYQKNTARRGLVYLVFGVVCLLAPITLQLFAFSKFNFPTFFVVIFSIMSVFVGLLVTHLAIDMIKKGGKWVINIDQEGINWQSPDESFDASFKYSIKQMKAVEINMKSDPLTGSGKYSYFIVKSDGDRHELSSMSGLSPKKVVNALALVGLPKIETRD